MDTRRKVRNIVTARPVTEGAGVRLRRAIGLGEPGEYDPFLLLDDFRSDEPDDYLAGFPWHPHRGIETVTYVLKGNVEHGDSTGTRGTIGPGDIQWMTAGSGIYHQEMPKGDGSGSMHGFQLWVNLPARDKMTAPRYRGVTAAEIPVVRRDDGAEIRVIAGSFGETSGPVLDVATRPTYLDVTLPGSASFSLETTRGDTVFLYAFAGEILLETERGETVTVANRNVALFGDGDALRADAGPQGGRFLLAAGSPIGEPIAWRGPIVMNTQEELRIAFDELSRGTFIKAKGEGGA